MKKAYYQIFCETPPLELQEIAAPLVEVRLMIREESDSGPVKVQHLDLFCLSDDLQDGQDPQFLC